MDKDVFDLSILDSGVAGHAVALARRGPDLAVAKIPLGQQLQDLLTFRDGIDASLRGAGDRPTRDKLKKYGEDLFCFVIRDNILRLYDRLPSTHVRVHVLSDHPSLKLLPLEYLQEPNTLPGPSRQRSVIRIVPTVGYDPPEAQTAAQELRILFVHSDPQDLGPVSWAQVKAAIERAYTNALPGAIKNRVVFEAIEGVDGPQLQQELSQRQHVDILHFMGHGRVENGIGQIVLLNGTLDARQLPGTIGGLGLKLVILSACNTSQEDPKDDFSGMAQALIQSKMIPAVIANQMPIEDSSVARFAGAFYGYLLRTGDIDQAVNEGRIALARSLEVDEKNDEAAVEWGIPTLYRHFDVHMLYTP